MEIGTIVDEGLGNASYLVDVREGRALVIDPGRDPRPYLEEAGRRRLRIAFVAETHLHADFVSGSRELQALGATVLASAEAGLRFPHRGLWDGETVDLGRLGLRALATPGHTPEHLSYVLLDDAVPVAVFTGGALLSGSVARTDLLGAEETEPLAHALFRSIRERLFTLPDDLPVHPTHGAGATFCSTGPRSGEGIPTTIGHERLTNPLLLAPDEGAFAHELIASYGSYPRYFLRLRDVNRRGPRIYGDRTPKLPALSTDQLKRAVNAGAELVDVRPIEDFAVAHVPGALSIQLRPAFATWLGWLVPQRRPLVFVLAEGQDRSELVRQCLSVGYEDLAGELAGGMTAWKGAGLPEERLPLVGPKELPDGTLVDIRQRSEFSAGHVPGALHLELGSLEEGAYSLPPGPLTMQCGHGERAMTAASLLHRLGREELTVLVGGPGDVCRASGTALTRDGST